MKNPAVPDIPDDDEVRRSVGYISLIIGNDALTSYGKVCALVPTVHMSSSVTDDIIKEIYALGKCICTTMVVDDPDSNAVSDYVDTIMARCDIVCKNLEVYKQAISLLKSYLFACVDD